MPSKFSDSPVAIDTFDFIENPLERIINLDEPVPLFHGRQDKIGNRVSACDDVGLGLGAPPPLCVPRILMIEKRTGKANSEKCFFQKKS